MLIFDLYQAKYYVEEVKDKSRTDIDVSDWEHEFLEDLPEQQNGYVFFMFLTLIIFSDSTAHKFFTVTFKKSCYFFVKLLKWASKCFA